MAGSLSASTESALVADALAARARAYAPYSRFTVGCAVLCDDGTVVTGCNVENASYGLCQCAERTALGAAVAQGKRNFVAVAVATASDPPSPPCGMCRQVLFELAPDAVVLMANVDGALARSTVRALLPGAFDAALLARGQGAK